MDRLGWVSAHKDTNNEQDGDGGIVGQVDDKAWKHAVGFGADNRQGQADDRYQANRGPASPELADVDSCKESRCGNDRPQSAHPALYDRIDKPPEDNFLDKRRHDNSERGKQKGGIRLPQQLFNRQIRRSGEKGGNPRHGQRQKDTQWNERRKAKGPRRPPLDGLQEGRVIFKSDREKDEEQYHSIQDGLIKDEINSFIVGMQQRARERELDLQ